MFFIYNIIYNESSFLVNFFHMECVHPLIEKDGELVFCLS